MANNLKVKIPKVYYSFGDWETGIKIIIMEDMSNLVQAGYFFGPGNPANWGKDLPNLIGETKIQPVDVLRNTFKEAARLHATFWRKEELLQSKWLRCVEWY